MPTPQELSLRDQKEARQREEDRLLVKASRIFLLVMLVIALYSLAAVVGVIPAAPWSPIGLAQQ